MENLKPAFENDLTELLEAIYLKYQYDFRDYSRPTIKRRMAQVLNNLNCSTMAVLQQKILHDPKLLIELIENLTIPLSEMFRDPSYFRAIRETVIPSLKTYPSLKIWVAGCSTGEEAYSLAILLKEEGLLERTIIYATDINPKSLEEAKAGIFKLDHLQKFTTNYQISGGKAAFSDYYTAAFDAAIFNKSLRRKIIFTDHSLATDGVFSQLQFISCRNVLIYFEKELQERAIGLFHDSLCPKGFLGLGLEEIVDFTKYANAFDLIVDTNQIYQKIKKNVDQEVINP